ncbi:MAG: hypothetical protein Q7U60_01575 [Candidatus Methanoperedens sp.]|nr:hypothetical protein [Candidatus Methanoperedens sp.]
MLAANWYELDTNSNSSAAVFNQRRRPVIEPEGAPAGWRRRECGDI